MLLLLLSEPDSRMLFLETIGTVSSGCDATGNRMVVTTDHVFFVNLTTTIMMMMMMMVLASSCLDSCHKRHSQSQWWNNVGAISDVAVERRYGRRSSLLLLIGR